MFSRNIRLRIGESLVKDGLITKEQLFDVLEQQKIAGEKIGYTLVKLGYINEDRFLETLAEQLGVAFINLSQYKVTADVANILTEGQSRRFKSLVIKETPDTITVAMADPTDLQSKDYLETLISPKALEVALIKEAQLLTALNQLFRSTDEIVAIAGQLVDEYKVDDIFADGSSDETDPANQTTVVKLLYSIFEDAVKVGASDIHIEPDKNVLRIRQRIDGELHENLLNEVNIASALVLRLKLMAGLNISEKRLPQDGRFHLKIKARELDVRISTMPITRGESVVMRLLDQSSGMIGLDKVGMPQKVLERVRKQIQKPQGLLLITGPTGSGKTTTLYGMLSELNSVGRKIITVEDPVEYELPRINQVQINHKIGLDFAKVLRTCLRQDPDVIMVGEMRDAETAEIGLRAALTGHFVLSTLHTNDAVATALRLLDMGAAGYLVASSLQMVIAQRLIKKNCSNCSIDYVLTGSEKSWLATMGVENVSHGHFKKGVGCNSCHDSGYSGRIGIFEVLELNESMMKALRQNDPEGFTAAALKSKNYVPLAKSAITHLMQGETTIEQLTRLIENVSDEEENQAEFDDEIESAMPLVTSSHLRKVL